MQKVLFIEMLMAKKSFVFSPGSEAKNKHCRVELNILFKVYIQCVISRPSVELSHQRYRHLLCDRKALA